MTIPKIGNFLGILKIIWKWHFKNRIILTFWKPQKWGFWKSENDILKIQKNWQFLREIFVYQKNKTLNFRAKIHSQFYWFSGAYSEWTDEDTTSPNYCANGPFMMAFVTLILFWILMPLIFCLTCCCCCICCAIGAAKARTQPNEEDQPNTEATEAKDVA